MPPEVPSPKASTICTAISERCEIQFLYQEQPVLLQPHILFCDIAGVAIVEGVVPRQGYHRFDLINILDPPVLKREPNSSRTRPSTQPIPCITKYFVIVNEGVELLGRLKATLSRKSPD
jgi:hypothetical protein